MVLVIVGILTSLVALSFAPREPSPQRESQRFYQVLETARQQAVLYNQDMGVELTPGGYRILQWRSQRWWSLDAPEFAEYSLPETLQQTLWINGLESEVEANDRGKPQPQILLFATGEVTPFEWTLKDLAGINEWRLAANPIGVFDLQLEPPR